jgi:hypothetical protein
MGIQLKKGRRIERRKDEKIIDTPAGHRRTDLSKVCMKPTLELGTGSAVADEKRRRNRSNLMPVETRGS